MTRLNIVTHDPLFVTHDLLTHLNCDP